MIYYRSKAMASKELRKQVTGMYEQMKHDELFDHAGSESRHVILQTDQVYKKVLKLSGDMIDINARAILGYIANMFLSIGDQGILVRIKGRDDIEMRGVWYAPDHQPSIPEINEMIFKQDNSVQIDLSRDTPSISISAYAQGINEDDLNELIGQLPEQKQFVMIKGLLAIAVDEFNQIQDS